MSLGRSCIFRRGLFVVAGAPSCFRHGAVFSFGLTVNEFTGIVASCDPGLNYTAGHVLLVVVLLFLLWLELNNVEKAF